MFARSVSFRLKPDSIAAFTKLIEDETLPLLRKQKGFQEKLHCSFRAAGTLSESTCGIRKKARKPIIAMGIPTC